MKERYKSSNVNKFYCETNMISSPYFKSDDPQKMLIASDIHYHSNVDNELFRLLVDYSREIKPDFIVMPGDQVETIDFIDNSKEKEFFESIIKDMAEVAPVIIIPGNHEIGFFGKENFSKRLDEGGKDGNMKSLRYFDSLNRFKNVYFLNNEQTVIKGSTFLGFNPRLATYLKKGAAKDITTIKLIKSK